MLSLPRLDHSARDTDFRGKLSVDRFGKAYPLSAGVIAADEVDLALRLAAVAYEQPSLGAAHDIQKARRDEERRQDAADRMTDIPEVQRLRGAYFSYLLGELGPQPERLVAGIEERGFLVARVTADEAAASQRAADVAKSHSEDYFSPVYAEGDLLAISGRGMVYRLDGATLDDKDAGQVLADIDQKPLLSISQARQVIDYVQEHDTTPSRWHGRNGGGGDADMGVLIGAMGDLAGGAGRLMASIERFLFGSEPPASSRPLRAAPERPTEGERVRSTIGRMDPQTRAKDPDVPRYHFGVDAEIVEDIRRRREAEERERRQRDRENERDRAGRDR